MDKEYLGFKELVITGEEANDLFNPESVSYTHLTLPTILLV